jgi:hypothetical protein
MPKHKLTIETDQLNGGQSADLFIAPLDNGQQTFTSADRINGGGGEDSIHAQLLSGSLNAHLKNVETGIFSIGTVSAVNLDLIHAAALKHLALKGGTADQQAPVTVNNAGLVNRLDVTGDAGQFLTVNGLDPAKSSAFILSLNGLLDKSEITLNSAAGDDFSAMTVNMAGASDATISGSCLGIANLTVNLSGKPDLNHQNYLKFDQASADGIRNLTISGKGDLTDYTSGDGITGLRSFDATGFDTGSEWSNIGGSKLTSVHCGDANDYLYVKSLGGSLNHKANVTLGNGDDLVDVQNGIIHGKFQHFDGGKGWDEFEFNGALKNLHAVAVNFEEVIVLAAKGTYDASGMPLINFNIHDAADAVTLENLADGISLNLYSDMPLGLTANVAHADTSKAESLRLLLTNDVTLGSSSAGFSSASLSSLEIASFGKAHTLFLQDLGSANDPTSVTVSTYSIDPNQDGRLTLDAAIGAQSHIGYLKIDNSAGIDMTGLEGAHVFLSAGATIVGSSADDILTGGSGDDTISTGGGNNTVISSAGHDKIMLLASSGLDVIEFRSQSHSAYGAADSVSNFNAFDVVDISALTGSVSFAGNYANLSTGLSHLSTSHVTAFYDTGNDHLYVDLNHDGALDSAHDLDVKLDIVSFNGWNISA